MGVWERGWEVGWKGGGGASVSRQGSKARTQTDSNNSSLEYSSNDLKEAKELRGVPQVEHESGVPLPRARQHTQTVVTRPTPQYG